MSFVIEKIKNLKYLIKIKISKKKIKKKAKKKFLKINKKTLIKGFRMGKAPIQLIKNIHKKPVNKQVIQKLIQKEFFLALKKKKIKLAGVLKSTSTTSKSKKNIKKTIIFDIFPKFDLNKKKLKKITKLKIKITDDDVKKTLLKLEKIKTPWKKKKKRIKLSDFVTIHYKAYYKKSSIPFHEVKNYSFIVGEKKVISEIEKKIMNKKVNDKFSISIKFPKLYPEEEIKGKKIKFLIQIKKVKTKKVKKKIKEIINSQKNKEESKKEFLKKIKKSIKQESFKISQYYIKQQIISHLLKKNEIDVPYTLVYQEIKALLNENKNIYKLQKKNFLKKNIYIELNKRAKKNVQTQLILGKLIKSEKLTPKYEKVLKLIKEIKQKKIKKKYQNIKKKEIYNYLFKIAHNVLLEKEILNFFLKKAKIKKKECSLKDLISFK